MHHPPAVRVLIDDSPWPRRLLLMGGTLAVLQVSWFVLLSRVLTWQTVAAGLSLLAALGFAWFRTQRSTSGSLHWDGLQWQWSDFTGAACTLRRHLDFQSLMLVSLHCPGSPPVWLWLQRSQDPHAWLALRRAVVHATSPEQVRRASRSAPVHYTGTP